MSPSTSEKHELMYKNGRKNNVRLSLSIESNNNLQRR